MSFNHGARRPIISVIVLLVLGVVGVVLCKKCGSEHERMITHWCKTTSDSDIPCHHAYDDYEYSMEDSVFDFGVQPLWIPTNLIVETMKRDELLDAALTKLGTRIRYHDYLKGNDANTYLERGQLEGVIGGDMPALRAAARSATSIVSLMQIGFTSVVANRLMLMEDLA